MNDNEKNNINDDENKYIYRYKKDDLKNEESSKGDDNTDKHIENESSEHKKVKEKKKKNTNKRQNDTTYPALPESYLTESLG